MRRAAAAIAAVLLVAGAVRAAPPSNDACPNALTMPDGPYPLTTAPLDAIEATPRGADEGVFSCAPADYTVWYRFTPALSATYLFTTCPVRGAAGNTALDTVIGVFRAPNGNCTSLASVACNDSDVCAGIGDPGTLTTILVGGETYYLAIGNWLFNGPLYSGASAYALHVERSGAINEIPVPLALDRVTSSSTVSAAANYEAPADTTCFQGSGQLPTAADGHEFVHVFTAPSAGLYSVRYVQDDDAGPLVTQDPVLYASSSLPSPGEVECIRGANRTSSEAGDNRSEEIDCVPLAAGESIYVFFDDAQPGNAGGPYGLEVTRCALEVEPNDLMGLASPAVCDVTGSAGAPGDADEYALGAPPAGSKIFAAIDAAAAGDDDFELRIVTTAGTLQYDDDDGTVRVGSNAPVIAGARATGAPAYAQVNLKDPGATSGPYRLHTRVETGSPQVAVESPSDAGFLGATRVTAGGFLRGTTANAFDVDCFEFVAREGDEIAMFADNNPDRIAGPIDNVVPVLRDLDGAPPAGISFGGQAVRNDLKPSPGTNWGTTPSITSSFWAYRARYSGAYMVCYTPDTGAGAPTAFPAPYGGSVSLNCGPIPPPASRVADVSITMSAPPGPHYTSSHQDLTITLTNDGDDPAQDVRWTDGLPVNLPFIGIAADDGHDGSSLVCTSLPYPQESSPAIACTVLSIPPHASVDVILTVKVGDCIGTGVTLSNTVSIVSTASTDPDTNDHTASVSFQSVSSNGYCSDDTACTINDRCEFGQCVTDPLDGDDHSVCTEDSCDPELGIIHDPSPGDQCDDGDPCTENDCDPTFGCVFNTPAQAGTPCTYSGPCAVGGVCDGAGQCGPVSVCDDGNVCTNDFTDVGNACACSHTPVAAGTQCDDGIVCTVGDACGNDGTCGGAPMPAPGEATGLIVYRTSAHDWLEFDVPDEFAMTADVLTGSLGSLPVGPVNGDETCLFQFWAVFGTHISIANFDVPAAGTGVWYLARARNSCAGPGPWGFQGDHGLPGAPRISSTCP